MLNLAATRPTPPPSSARRPHSVSICRTSPLAPRRSPHEWPFHAREKCPAPASGSRRSCRQSAAPGLPHRRASRAPGEPRGRSVGYAAEPAAPAGPCWPPGKPSPVGAIAFNSDYAASSDARFQPAHGTPRARPAPRRVASQCRNRLPDLGRAAGKSKSIRHDANHLRGHAVDLQRCTQHVGGSLLELALPKVMAHDHHPGLLPLFIRGECPPKTGASPAWKKVHRPAHAHHLLGLGSAGERHKRRIECGDAHKGLILSPPNPSHWHRRMPAPGYFALPFRPENHQPPGVRKWQWPEQHGIDHAEDRDRGGDPQHSVSTATTVKPRLFSSVRKAYRRSFSICVPLIPLVAPPWDPPRRAAGGQP